MNPSPPGPDPAATVRAGMERGSWGERTWSVALFGRFNPAITTAAWLRRHRVVDDAVEDLDDTTATIRAGTLLLEVSLERFLVQTTDPATMDAVPRAVHGVFRVLEHTPIDQLALGCDGEWSARDAATLGEILGRFGATAPVLDELGPVEARSTTIRAGALSGAGGVCHVTVEDSDVLPHGAYLSIVDEVEIEADVGATAPAALVELDTRWPVFLRRAEQVADGLLGLGLPAP